VAQRIQDAMVMRLLNLILKSTGKKGVPQGGVISPLLSNVYLMVILIDSHPRNDWLMKAVDKRLREELAKLRVEINEDKSRTIDLRKGGNFAFLGFEYRLVLGRNQKWRPQFVPKLKKRTALFAALSAAPECLKTEHINRSQGQRKRRATDRSNLRSVAPFPDPTRPYSHPTFQRDARCASIQWSRCVMSKKERDR
jgi:RNA-directed DNA polymerase